MSGLQRELVMGYDDPRFGGLLQQPISTGGNAGIDWETMFPSLKPSIDASRAAYEQQRNMVAANESMAHLWPMFSQPSSYDPSGFPKQLIDSGQTTLNDLVNQFNQKVSGNRLRVLPNGQVSFTQDVEASDPWGALVSGGLMAGVGALSGGFGLADAFNGLGGQGAFNPLADFGSDYFSGAGNYAGGLTDASWGVNPQGAGMNWYDDFLNSIGIDPGSTQFAGGNSIYDMTGGVLNDLGSFAMNDVGPGPAGTNLQDIITKIDSLPPGAGTAAKSALGRILNGQGSATDWTSILGTLAATGLGVYGANKQSDALSSLASQYMNFGAPYRARLAQSYADPEAFLKNSPDIQAAVKMGTDALSRSLSATGGNPAASGRPLQEMQNYATNALYGQLGNERQRLANFGGLSALTGAAPAANMASIGQQGNVYNALGYGLDQLTKPSNSLTELARALGISGLA